MATEGGGWVGAGAAPEAASWVGRGRACSAATRSCRCRCWVGGAGGAGCGTVAGAVGAWGAGDAIAGAGRATVGDGTAGAHEAGGTAGGTERDGHHSAGVDVGVQPGLAEVALRGGVAVGDVAARAGDACGRGAVRVGAERALVAHALPGCGGKVAGDAGATDALRLDVSVETDGAVGAGGGGGGGRYGRWDTACRLGCQGSWRRSRRGRACRWLSPAQRCCNRLGTPCMLNSGSNPVLWSSRCGSPG